MARLRATVMLAAALAMGLAGCRGREGSELILATTTSVQDAGLLDSLLPPFERSQRVRIKVIAVGTGAALEMARRRDADLVIAHAPELERRYAADGHLVGGRLVMRNDFVLVGPPADSAGAAAAATLDDAMRAIATGGWFVSRGDGSGTEERERALWRAAGIAADTLRTRVETGQGQGATLFVASERGAYALTDRATFTVLGPRLSLGIIAEGDPRLANEYRVHRVPSEDGRTAAHANAFIEYLVSAEAQEMIGQFGVARFGRQLFFPASGG
ncbi:MAG TPA: substrate-binding domain-containing protein [Gemmatimonadales bacterium]|nr:substrate-binding domain-containing protein [Gemmatimonadales bacterium]